MPETRDTLLVVDDDPAIRIPIYEYLTEIGYRVRTAEHGLAGLIEIQRDPPEILLSDLNMPHMSGFELLSVVRHRFPSVQTIAMSATVFADGVPNGVVADAFFQKGGQLPSLLKVIKNLPPRRRKRARSTRARSRSEFGPAAPSI
jgi:DNA-binding response OmpR family regulator